MSAVFFQRPKFPTRGVLGRFVIPCLARKLASKSDLHDETVYITIASVLMNCLFPAAVIIILDTVCLGNWATLWRPCRRDAQQFNMQSTSAPPVGWSNAPMNQIYAAVMRSYEVCDPSYARAATCMSRCVKLTMLRLQDIWLEKLVISGFIIPAGRIITGYSEGPFL